MYTWTDLEQSSSVIFLLRCLTTRSTEHSRTGREAATARGERAAERGGQSRQGEKKRGGTETERGVEERKTREEREGGKGTAREKGKA